MLKKITKRQWTILIAIIILSVIAYFILPVSVPLIIAFITALLLNPFVRFFSQRFNLSRNIAVTIVFVLFLLVLATIGTYTTTKAVGQVIKITENAPQYISSVEDVLSNLRSDFANFTEEWPKAFVDEIETRASDNLQSFEQQVTEWIKIERISQIFVKIPDYLISIIVYLIALFLFMVDLPHLRNKFYGIMTDSTKEKFKFMNTRLSYVLLGFLKAQFLVSLIIFSVALIGLLFITPEIAFVMSIIIWLVDLIPIIGSIVILGPWAMYMFLTGDMIMGTKLAILAIVLLTIRRTVEPKVMGHHIGLSPLPTLIAMYIGLQLVGILGFFLGPLVVIIFNSAKEAGIIKLNVKI
ncbi:sporulation integral membrane protein YtvI [Halalkalibacillus sediminis]|uniref:Sporulation integral membrane protein YtvI n=1 Tax=Halalkalibacillus sediminis TaxID=2018042 RepID=A0A2I0QW31_9BACI|nr:sporulation integral membrane protein YtvI [Halalkalibacillus sediminis]PKR78509.1 sporulation integral membrane protein YtvI [Halalkalibacillus sediminis]